MRTVSFRCLLIVSLVLVVARVGEAQVAATDRARADSLFEQAKGLMAESRFFEACPKLEEAQRIAPGAGGTMLALGLCHEGEGKLASAAAELREAVSMARSTHNRDREQLALEHLGALTPHVPKIVVDDAGSEANLSIDGHVARAGAGVEVDGGEHVIRVKRPGLPDWEERVSVGSRDDVRVVTPPPPPSLRIDESAPKQAESRPRRAHRLRSTGLTLGAIGVASTALGATFGLLALEAQSRSKAACADDPCDSRAGVRHHEDAQRDARIADFGFLVGGVAVVTGVSLLVFGRRLGRPDVTAVPGISRDAASLTLRGRF